MFSRLSQLPALEQLGLGMACAAVLLLAADHFVVKPVSWKLKQLDIKIEAAEQKVAFDYKSLQYKKSVEEQYAQVKDLIGVSKSDQDGLDFVGCIDDMAPRNGVSVKSRKLQTEPPSDYLETYFVKIGGFEASINALINFLNEIETSPGLLRVQKLSISSRAANDMVKGSLVISKVMTLADKQE